MKKLARNLGVRFIILRPRPLDGWKRMGRMGRLTNRLERRTEIGWEIELPLDFPDASENVNIQGSRGLEIWTRNRGCDCEKISHHKSAGVQGNMPAAVVVDDNRRCVEQAPPPPGLSVSHDPAPLWPAKRRLR
jgi:hypothetical protein